MKFLEEDLPAIIRYIDKDEYVYINKMSEVDWTSKFEVYKRNINFEDIRAELSSKLEVSFEKVLGGPNPSIDMDYLRPLMPLKGLLEDAEEDVLVQALNKAIDWSKNPFGTVERHALILNLMYQITGKAKYIDLRPEDKFSTLVIHDAESLSNRYLIDYVSDSDQAEYFLCIAPNAVDALEQLKKDKGDIVKTVVRIGRVDPVEVKGVENTYLYSIKYRLIYESVLRHCYFYSGPDLKGKEEVGMEFQEQYPYAIVYSVSPITGNPLT